MGLQIYKPTKAVKGAAAHFSFKSKGDKKGVFAELIKQTGWNQEARGGQGNGTFKDGEKALVKFSSTEIGGLIHALEHLKSVQFFHKTDEGSTTISFGPYKGKIKVDNEWVDAKEFTGFSLGLSKASDKKWSISFTFPEAIELREWLKNALRHIFDGIYSDDLKKAKEYSEKKEKQPTAEKPKSVKDFVEDQKPNLAQEDAEENGGDSDIPF